MTAITYREIRKVYLNGKPVREIRRTQSGWFRYYQKGQKIGGVAYLTLRDCKDNIEGEQ